MFILKLGLISLKPRVLNELGMLIPKPCALGTASNFKPKNSTEFLGPENPRFSWRLKLPD